MIQISVIIPTFNRSDIIYETIKSVYLQDYLNNIEILVIDDGSTDGTRETIQKLPGNINYIYVNHSGLPSVARNVGIKNATGEFIAFLDSDDVWLPKKLIKQIQILEKNPNIGIIASNAYIMKENGEKTFDLYHNEGNKNKCGFLFPELLKNNFLITSSVVIRRESLKNVHQFSEKPELRGIEDYDLWLRIALHFNVYYDPEPLLYYRDSGTSIRSEQSLINHWINMHTLYQDLEKDISLNFRNFDKYKKKDMIRNVKKMEKESISNLFYRLIGNRDFFLISKYSLISYKYVYVFISTLFFAIVNYLGHLILPNLKERRKS